MNQTPTDSRRRLLSITGAMSVAAVATGVGIVRGDGSYWSFAALLAFLLVAGTSLYQLYR